MEKPSPSDPALEPGPSMRHVQLATPILASRVDRRPYHLLNLVVLLTVALLALCLFRDESLPPPEKLDPSIAEEPLQGTTDKAPFDRSIGPEVYHIVPVASYDIKALVVSTHDSKSFIDYIHKEVGDFINISDLCVVWGTDATTGIYRDISASNSEWECNVRLKSERAREIYKTDGLSNNHILSNEKYLVKALRGIRVGDQIRLRGYLVNYANLTRAPDQYRNTSTVRTDTGDGACEIIYVNDLTILSAGTRVWLVLRWVCLMVLGVCAVVWLILPYRGRV